jgi:carotenoid cleavage dioxygenase-like enzyme
LLGLSGFAGAIDIDKDATETSIVLVPRYLFDETEGVYEMNYLTDDRIIVCKLPNHFNFHFGNAFEDDAGNVVFDTVQTMEISLDGMSEMTAGVPIWDLPNPFALVTPNTLVRYTLDVAQKRLAREVPHKTLSTRIPEFPSLPKELSTRKHRYLYPVASHFDICSGKDDELGKKNAKVKGSGPAGAIQKVDTEHPDLTETFVFEPYEFPGEAVFVAKAGSDVTQDGEEDAGYLIVHVVNGRDKTTDFCIFDVEGKGSLEKGPIVRQQLPTFLPHMLHGNFFPVTFDFDAAVHTIS